MMTPEIIYLLNLLLPRIFQHGLLLHTGFALVAGVVSFFCWRWGQANVDCAKVKADVLGLAPPQESHDNGGFEAFQLTSRFQYFASGASMARGGVEPGGLARLKIQMAG